jgi:hypothetical protein
VVLEVVREVCKACNLDIVEEVELDHLLKRLAEKEVEQGNKLRKMFACVDPF